MKHINISQLVGPSHVGIGLDFVYYPDQMFAYFMANPEMYPDSYSPNPDEWCYLIPEKLPNITEILISRGYSEEDIRGILGENYLRVAGKVWKEAREHNINL